MSESETDPDILTDGNKYTNPGKRKGNNAPFGYLFFRTLPHKQSMAYSLKGMFFKIMLNVFYSSIIIENEELIPDDGNPCIICANHSNSVMDAVVLVTSVSRKVSTLQSL